MAITYYALVRSTYVIALLSSPPSRSSLQYTPRRSILQNPPGRAKAIFVGF